MKGLKISLSTSSLGIPNWHIRDVFDVAHDVGFNGIELLILNIYLGWGPESLKSLAQEFGLKILTCHQPWNIWQKICRIAPSWIEPWEEFSKILEVPLVIHSAEIRKRTNFLNKFEKINLQLELKIEPNSKIAPWQLSRIARGNNWGICFDTGYIYLAGYDLFKSWEVMSEEITNIHLSDAVGEIKKLLPGQGQLPLKQFLNHIKGYRGIVTLEVSPFSLEFWSRKRVKENLKRSFNFISENLN